MSRARNISSDLAGEGVLAFQEKGQGELLGQGRPTTLTSETPFLDAADHGSENGSRVDAAVLVELGVLGGDDSELEVIRNQLRRQLDPPLEGECCHLRAVGGVDLGGRRGAICRQLVELRDVQGAGDEPPGESADQAPGKGCPHHFCHE